MGEYDDEVEGISIHAPRVGSDGLNSPVNCGVLIFQSTLPVWGATTGGGCVDQLHRGISIHAPRVGSDIFRPLHCRLLHNFNPRSPCGERRLRQGASSRCGLFQSTLPVWGATGLLMGRKRNNPISIHAPRVGSDESTPPRWLSRIYFNPRSPCGERPHGARAERRAVLISIHAPRVGSDYLCMLNQIAYYEFQSTLPVWGATVPTYRRR